VEAADFVGSIRAGYCFAREAVTEPMDGTILSVMKDVSDEAEVAIKDGKDIYDIIHRMLQRAKTSVSETQYKLDVLKKAGVVDAGAKGFAAILEGICRYITDGKIIRDRVRPSAPAEGSSKDTVATPKDLAYCTEVFVQGTRQDQDTLRSELKGMGDSLIINEGPGSCKVHIHTNRPGDVLNLLQGYGELHRVKIDNMRLQVQRRGAEIKREHLVIVTDSTSDLPQKLCERYKIEVVPLYVRFGDETYREKEDLTIEDFYKKLISCPHHPKTSQPNVGDFVKRYTKLKERYENILSIHISTHLSGTLQAASLASKGVDGVNIKVIDSRLVSMGLGFVCIEAARLAREGYKIGDIEREIKRVIDDVRIFFTVDTLRYLKRGGRIGRVKGVIGTLLGIKPILTISDGRVCLVSKAKGKRSVIPEVVRLMEQNTKPGTSLRISILHSGCEDRAKELEDVIKRSFSCKEIVVSKIGCVVGSHIGPGALGIVYYKA
jgi:hypothetical protein